MYKTIQSTKANKSGQKMFHPRAVYVGNVRVPQLAKEVAEYSSLSTGDVKNTIDNLILVMTRHLQASETVTLDGLGNFSLMLRSKGKGFATAEEVDASQALMVVRFTPAATRNTDGTVATRALITGVRCVPYVPGMENNGGSGTPGTGGQGGQGGTGQGGSEDDDPLT